MSNILDGLNDMQREGALTTEGPVLLLAGAGSGKTRVLTYRTAYLIEEKGVAPWNILAITFTNKAANEMKERIENLCGSSGGMVWVATFHSTCGSILRRHAELMGYTSQFTVYDTSDQKTVIKRIVKDWDLDTKSYNVRSIRSAISSAKNRMESPDFMYQTASNRYETKVAEIYEEYQKRLKENDAMDFDDMLIYAVQLFKKYPEVLAQWQERFRYIMVDEYQDTNAVQFELIRLLADKYKNICVVGDDDQSIYKFRGADITNILDFEKTYKGAKVIKLEQNYRSTSNILNTANEVIKNNFSRMDKRLWTEQEGGDKVDYRVYKEARDEAEGIALDIKENRSSFDFGDCAVLYRTNAQSRIFEDLFVVYGIPYRLVGGVNFYERAEIKDMLAYLKTIANGIDDLAVERIINVPKRGIGKTSIDKIRSMALTHGIGFYEELKRSDSNALLNNGTKAKLAGFVALIEELRSHIGEYTVKELIEDIFEKTGYKAELVAEKTVEAEGRIENIGELLNKAAEFNEVEDRTQALSLFLEDVSLTADIDSVDDDENKVLLMTIHGAKGLEFPRVYIAGMEEGLFPSSMSICDNDEQGVEEERRLCYVGITRAKEKLTLSSTQLRMINGETNIGVPSRFIGEIPDDLLQRNTSAPRVVRGATGFSGSLSTTGGGFGARMPVAEDEHVAKSQVRWNNPYVSKPKEDVMAGVRKGSEIVKGDEDSLGYKVGDRVRHIRFGEGEVLKIEEEATDFNVTVLFDRVGEKDMYASFAKLKKLD